MSFALTLFPPGSPLAERALLRACAFAEVAGRLEYARKLLDDHTTSMDAESANGAWARATSSGTDSRASSRG